jgi:acetoin utilization deacetylase AcuC-like enzyme
VNGSLLAAKSALQYGVSCHLAGGTHHSHFDFGSGFCVFNDLAYTALTLTRTKEVKKILIFDCDVHQGDGTARILDNNDNTFTCSIHAKKNFPYRKASSDLDIDLEDGLPWSLYRERLIEGLNKCMERFSPDLILYVAGVDVHENDKLGRLGIDDKGLFEREIMVLTYFKKKGIPLATVMGGGYSDDRKELAKRHSTVIKAAHEVWSYV